MFIIHSIVTVAEINFLFLLSDLLYHLYLLLQVENELVDLIDELLERDAGTVNSTIIGKFFRY